ncbi:PREDICTED: C-type lectin 37Da-like [Rhagoletis zephyria]|uniref:C-type lectin 37Da-like n=1 Tax=Rhagoletis zephyria TaxID=28612 RepID=UPI0008118B2C|nr:PREDICTED: C-type lectin 37Da-like [Rhagoletis zephyria]
MEMTKFVVLLCFTSVFADSLIASNDECNSDNYPFTKIGNKYYLVNTGMKMNWFEAAHVCRTYDSDLATIESEAEMNALAFHLTTNGQLGKYFWTSGSDLAVEGKFMSLSNGRPMTYTKWSGGQPDNAGNNEDCVHLWNVNNLLHMNDYPCTGEGYPICERRKPSKCCDVENCINIVPKCALSKLLQTYLQTASIFNCVG